MVSNSMQLVAQSSAAAELTRVCEFVIAGSTVNISRNQLLTRLVLDRDYSSQEFQHLDGMATLTIIEINTITDLLNISGVLECIVLQNQLFEV
jgi:hypothetical protein